MRIQSSWQVREAVQVLVYITVFVEVVDLQDRSMLSQKHELLIHHHYISKTCGKPFERIYV